MFKYWAWFVGQGQLEYRIWLKDRTCYSGDPAMCGPELLSVGLQPLPCKPVLNSNHFGLSIGNMTSAISMPINAHSNNNNV